MLQANLSNKINFLPAYCHIHRTWILQEMTQNSFDRIQRMCITIVIARSRWRPHAGCTRSECCTIFKLVTALIMKAMRNKKRRRRIFIGPCTKPAYTGKGFHFRVFHKTNKFSINASFFGCLIVLFAILGCFTATKEKARAKRKQHLPQLITKSPTKGSLQASA